MIPYVQKRIPKWSETDSAQIVYTARFVDYAMDAIEGWFRDVLGVDWFLMNTELDMGTPFVKIEMEFKSPLTPHDELEVRVLVDRLGSSSFTFDVVGTRNGNQTSFESTFVCSLVKKSTMKSINIPGDLRQRAEDYVEACSKARPERVESV